MARGKNSLSKLMLLAPVGAVVLATAATAEAATPTYYNNLATFQGDITFTVTDDYQNPAYIFIQSNAVMSAVLGETDYMTTGFMNLNIVSGGVYCAGCNGSFELSFQTTTVGNAAGVNGVGMNIVFNDPGTPYFAYITFADGTNANIQLPAAGNFWAVAAPERIERIHFGLSMGGTTTGGSFGIDNLIIGDGNIGTCEVDDDCVEDMNPCTDPVCNAGMCGVAFNVAPCNDGNICTDEVCGGGVCVPQFNAAPCDDGNACTDEVCSGGACTPSFNAAPCDDEEVCTEGDVCALGVCQGSLVDCEDGNICTTNFCDFGVGCDVVNNNEPCDDDNVCTEKDMCSAGACGGVQSSCGDDDMCTMDSCDPVLGCINDPAVGCCVGDEDCGPDETCDTDANACVPVPTGSSSGPGDTGTPGETGTPGDTGLDGSGDGDSGVVTGGADTGGVDTGIAGSTGDGSGSGLDGGETPTPGGCACTTTPSPRGGLWWLMAVAGVLVRRRRAA